MGFPKEKVSVLLLESIGAEVAVLPKGCLTPVDSRFPLSPRRLVDNLGAPIDGVAEELVGGVKLNNAGEGIGVSLTIWEFAKKLGGPDPVFCGGCGVSDLLGRAGTGGVDVVTEACVGFEKEKGRDEIGGSFAFSSSFDVGTAGPYINQ